MTPCNCGVGNQARHVGEPGLPTLQASFLVHPKVSHDAELEQGLCASLTRQLVLDSVGLRLLDITSSLFHSEALVFHVCSARAEARAAEGV